MTTRSSGFTLIELLVVVAIIGILAAVGVTSYSGYVNSARITTAENMLTQIALAQQEFFTNNRTFAVGDTYRCEPADINTSSELENELFAGRGFITQEVNEVVELKADFDFCVEEPEPGGFEIRAVATDESGIDCILTLDNLNVSNRRGDGC